jgi:hypothetical protein
MAGVQYMSKSKKLIGIIHNNLFARRDNDYPENEESDTVVSTLEDIARQVQKEAAENQQMLEVKEFFSPTHVMARKKADDPVVPVNTGASTVPRKEKARKRVRLTADQYEELIEKDLTVLEIVGQVIDRNVAIRSRLKISPA